MTDDDTEAIAELLRTDIRINYALVRRNRLLGAAIIAITRILEQLAEDITNDR